MSEQFVLSEASYGKSQVRLVKVTRTSDQHELRDLKIDVALRGDFDLAYRSGDNTSLLATDTMRNTVYALAKNHDLVHIEAFGMVLAQHFLATGPTVQTARITITEYLWNRIDVHGKQHDHAFTRAAGERTAVIEASAEAVTVTAGIDDLLILKTTNSGWEDFFQDQYTTLPDTNDRILATKLTSSWVYNTLDSDFEALWYDIRSQILATFTDHYSPSVQNTLYRMGSAVLNAFPAVQKISFTLPNKHHILFPLKPFGLENQNEIFQVTSDPYGLIQGTVERKQQ